MSAPKVTGRSITVALVPIGAGELRVLLYPETNPKIDLRWFSPGGGPAAVPMPTASGIAFPVMDAAEVIEAIKTAQRRSIRERRAGLGGEA